MSADLVVRDLNVSYGPIAAVKGISFEVPRGRIVALLGANGAGKSSTLNAILAQAAPGPTRGGADVPLRRAC